jgi:hypothetical protein
MSNGFLQENADDWIPASETARLCGVSRQAIFNLVGARKLPTLTLLFFPVAIWLVHRHVSFKSPSPARGFYDHPSLRMTPEHFAEYIKRLIGKLNYALHEVWRRS